MVMFLQKTKMTGYSIVELVVVILILAILFATFLPKYIEMREDAKDSVQSQLVASFQQAIQFSSLKWQALGRPQGGNISNGPQIEYATGLMVTVDRNTGFPVGDHNRDMVNNMNLRDCVQVFSDLVQQEFTVRHRGQVNNSTYDDFDVIVTRTNANPDICNYYWSESISSRPSNAAPSTGQGFQYFPATGVVQRFDFT